MLVICLDLAKNNFCQYLLSVFLINDTINFEDNFVCTLLVVIKPEFSIQSL